MVERGFVKPEDLEPDTTGFEFYIDAFRELGTCRPGGLDLQPIPFTAIAEYSRIYELRDFDDFAAIIRAMDSAFMTMDAATRSKERDKKNATDNANAKNSNKR